MKNKKIFVLLSALALSLAACGSKPGSSSQGGGDNTSSSSSSSQQQTSSSSQQGSQSSSSSRSSSSSSQSSKSSSDSGSQTVAVTSLTLNKTTLSLEEGKSETLSVTVTPSNATDATVTWESSNTAVATVSRLGKVSAVKAGTATITVKSNSNPTVTAQCALTVTEEGGKYGSVNKPKTVAQILAIAAEECKNKDDKTAEPVYVKGIVWKAPTNKGTFSQNIYLKDALTDQKDLLVFSANHDELKEPYKNDEVVLHGYLMNYNGTTIEISNVTIDGAKVYPAIDTVTRGTSTITYSVEHGSVNAEAPRSGKNLSEFSFSVTPEANYKVDSVSINGTEVTAQADGSYKSVIKGDMSVQVEISEVGVENLRAVMKYTAPEGATTSENMTGGNDAAKVGLDPTLFSVVSGNETGLYAGLNVANNIRLYNNRNSTTDKTDGTHITVSSARATIKKIDLTLASTSVADAILQVKAGDTVVTGENLSYDINASSFTLKNITDGPDSKQIHISQVAITYEMKAEVHATAIAVAPTSLEIEVGNNGQLAATLTPENATDVVVWSSSADTIATVDQTGKVTAVAEGSATITAKVSDEIKATATITVKAAKVINYGTAEAPLTVAEAKAVLDETGTNESKQPLFVKGIVSQNTALSSYGNFDEVWLQNADGSVAKEFELYRVKFDSSVTDAPTTENGLAGYEVVAKGYGKIFRNTYELTTSSNEPKNPLIIAATAPAPTEATGIALDKASAELEAGETLQLTATLSPAGATGTVVWSSSAEGVATVDQTGKVVGVAAGSATITAKISDSIKAECAVTVKAAAQVQPLTEAVTLNYSSLTGKGAEITSADVALATVGQGNSHVKAVEVTKIYDGNGSGGAYANTAGFLKTGTGSVAGQIKLTLDALANKVEILCHDFYKKNDSNPTNSNTFSVNGSATQLAPYNTEATFGTLTFDLAEDSKTVTIDINKRAFIKEIKISYAQAAIAQPVGSYHGQVKLVAALGGAYQPVDMELAADSVAISINGQDVEVTSYVWDGKNLSLSIVTSGDFGTLTASYDETLNAFTVTGVSGANGQALDPAVTVVLYGHGLFYNCNGTTAELQNQFQRRYWRPGTDGSWQKDNSNGDRVSADETNRLGNSGNGVKLRPCGGQSSSGEKYRVSISLKNDFAETKAVRALSFWVFNPSENDITLRAWGYQATGYNSNYEFQANNTLIAKAGQWTYMNLSYWAKNAETGLAEVQVKNIYNFQVADFTGSGVALTFENFCLL